jgi:tetratricopeptide (TPR) repeat protein
LLSWLNSILGFLIYFLIAESSGENYTMVEMHSPCPDAGELFAYASGSLDGVRSYAVSAHVAMCALCTKDVAGFGEVALLMHSVHEAPAQLALARGGRRLRAALEAEPEQLRTQSVALRVVGKSRFSRERILLVAAIAVVFGAVSAFGAIGLVFRLAPEILVPELALPQSALQKNRTTSESQQNADAETDAVTLDSSRLDDLSASRSAGASLLLPISSPSNGQDEEQHRLAMAQPSRVAVPPATVSAPRSSERHRAENDKALPLRASRARDSKTEIFVARAQGTPTPEAALATAWHELDDAPSGDPRWLDVGEMSALAGSKDRAQQAFVKALAAPKGIEAANRLSRMATDGSLNGAAAINAIEADDAARQSPEGMRLICEWSLRYRGDAEAVASCQAFGQHYPAHPDMRSLALAAGRIAEFRLLDLRLAEREYSRAILLSQYANTPGTAALLARARCRSKIGEREEARADLRLFLHIQPEAKWREDVRSLAKTLDFTLP